MKTLGLASFALGLLVVLTAHGGDEAAALKKEQAALQGVWKVISLETPNGKDDNIAGATLEFDKEVKNLTFTKGSDTKKGTIKLNPAAKPKEIDIVPGEDANKKMEGIYVIEKDTLKICICTENSNDGRPNEFAVKEGKGYVLVTLERAK